jgi:ABC-type transport system involved in cytochrome c biogenesis permease subunit
LLGIPLYVLGRLGIDPARGPWSVPIPYAQLSSYVSAALEAVGGVLAIVGGFSLLGELASRHPRRACLLGVISAAVISTAVIAGSTAESQELSAGAVTSNGAWLVGLIGGLGTVMSILGVQGRAASARIEPIGNLIYRAMQVGVLLLAAGTIVGGVWAYFTWDGPWGRDPKVVSALITLLVYLVPLHGRFAGWLSTFGLVASSVVCFLAVLISWYGMNFVMRTGLHRYGFTEGGGSSIVIGCTLATLAVVGAAAWRRSRSQ